MTPWDSLTHAAVVHYPIVPVALLLWDKYDSIANLQHFPHPVCVICSTKDEILPLPLGLNLYAHLGQLDAVQVAVARQQREEVLCCLPAWLFFGLWIVIQLGGAAQQRVGAGVVF